MNINLKKVKFLSIFLFIGLINISYADINSEIVAIIGQIEGKVTIETKTFSHTIDPYSQLSRNNVITVSEGSTAQVIYKKSGEDELWGKGKFMVGENKSTPIIGKPITTKRVPPVLQYHLANVSKVIKSYKRAGMVRVRGISKIKLKEIESVYQELKQEQSKGDYYAELYLLNSLYSERDYKKLEEVLSKLQSENENDQGIKQLIKKYNDALK